MKRKAGRAAGHGLARGPQGQGPGAASAGAQRRQQPAEYRFRRDLYSQQSTFPLVRFM